MKLSCSWSVFLRNSAFIILLWWKHSRRIIRTAVFIKSFLVYNSYHDKVKPTLESICVYFISWRVVVAILLDNELPSGGRGKNRLKLPLSSYIIIFLVPLPFYKQSENTLTKSIQWTFVLSSKGKLTSIIVLFANAHHKPFLFLR